MTVMTFMSDKRQLEIVEAVKVAADLAAAGTDPTEAIVKAAGDIKANEHVLQRMVEAFNTSATLTHMKTAGNEKAASFPIADYDKAKKSLFPEGAPKAKTATVKRAVSLELPDLRMAKVAFFCGLGDRYKVVSGEHKDKKGVIVNSEESRIEEEHRDGKTSVRKNTEDYSVTLKFDGGGEGTFTDPDAELKRDYDAPGVTPEPTEAKAASEKVAFIERFYCSLGDKFTVMEGDHKDKVGTCIAKKSTSKTKKSMDGKTQTTSESCDSQVTLELPSGTTWVCTNPTTALKRKWDDEGKCCAEPCKVGADKTAAVTEVWQVPECLQVPVGTPIPRDFNSLQKHALSQVEYWKKSAAEHRREYEGHKATAAAAVDKIASAFREVGRPDWAQFEGEILALHGADAKPFLDTVFNAGRLGSVKCARAAEGVKVAFINDNTELHKLFEVIKIASELAVDAKVAQEAEEATYAGERAKILGGEKTAGVMIPLSNPLGMAAGLAQSFDSSMGEPPKPKGKLNPSVGLESELQKARLQAAIQEMMTQDPTIAAHAAKDPAKIMRIIEELSKVHPKILEMPSVMNSGVRKALELGSIEPFELKQLQSLGEPAAPAPQQQQA